MHLNKKKKTYVLSAVMLILANDYQPEDDVPLAQSIQRLPAHMFLITVGDPQKIGDPISAHIIYTVHTKVCEHLLIS